MALFEPVFEALNRDGVRYVVVGGVAVVLHGYARLTADLDLAVDLEPAEARKAIETIPADPMRPVDLFTRSPIPSRTCGRGASSCRSRASRYGWHPSRT